jgi:hypothetical protein
MREPRHTEPLYSFMRSEAVASILGRTDQAALPLVLLADYWV